MNTEAPLKKFADAISEMENPKTTFTTYGNTFNVGDRVIGTWVDCDGKTYPQKGIIVSHELTGLWVQTEPDGGITEVKRFWTLFRDEYIQHRNL